MNGNCDSAKGTRVRPFWLRVMASKVSESGKNGTSVRPWSLFLCSVLCQDDARGEVTIKLDK